LDDVYQMYDGEQSELWDGVCLNLVVGWKLE